MKKIDLKSFIFGFSICLVLSVVIVGASSLFKASDIEYTPSDTTWNVNNVGAALDSLSSNQIKVDLLWTNPSITSAFSTTKISLDLSDYDYVIIDAYQNIAATTYNGYGHKSIFKVGSTDEKLLGARETSTGDYNITYRDISVDTTGITLTSVGVLGEDYTIRNSSSNWAVPVHIWGIKNLEIE